MKTFFKQNTKIKTTGTDKITTRIPATRRETPASELDHRDYHFS